jgi:hypothetical protein
MLTERFTFLCTKEERRLIRHLAKCFQRSQGGVIRFLIREAITALPIMPDFDKRGEKATNDVVDTDVNASKELYL